MRWEGKGVYLSLEREDPLEKEMATHSSILAWDIPWTEGTWQATAHEVLRAGQDLATEQQQHG